MRIVGRNRSAGHLTPVAISAAIALSLGWALGCGGNLGRDPVAELRDLVQARRFDASIERAEALLEERPGDPEVLYLYGAALSRSGQPTRAVWPLREAREHPDQAVPAGVELAAAALKAGQFDAAIEAANAILEIEPEHEFALGVRAQAHARKAVQAQGDSGKEDWEAALEDLDRLLAEAPDSEAWIRLRLQSLLGLGRLDEVKSMFADLDAKESPFGSANPRMCAARAVFTKESGEKEAAEQIFADCLERHPGDLGVLTQAVQFFDETGRPEEGDAVFAKALAAEPDRWEIRQQIAERARRNDRPVDFEALMLEATKLQRSAAPAWSALAYHYYENEDLGACISAWESRLAAAPLSNDERFSYAEALLLAGRYDDALEAGSDLPEVFQELLRGRVLLEQGRPEAALEHFEAGLRLWPNNAVARYLAARAAEKAGKIDTAISHYRESLRAGAGETDAGLRLAKLYLAEGKLSPAYEALRRGLKDHQQDPEFLALAIRLSTSLGMRRATEQAVAHLAMLPDQQARALAAAAALVARTRGSAAAASLITDADIDLDDPGNAEALEALARHLVAAEDSAGALRRVDAALAAHPDSARLHSVRAKVLSKTGAASEQVRESYERALAVDPDDGAALVGLARLAESAGDEAQALEYYERAAAADPEDAAASRKRAELTPDAEESRRRLEAHLEKFPFDGRAAALLAVRSRESGAPPEQVRELAERAVRFQGGRAAYAILTDVLLTQGDARGASQLLREKREGVSGRAPSLDYQLARALVASGDSSEARVALERALEVPHFPERAEAESVLARLDEDAVPKGSGSPP